MFLSLPLKWSIFTGIAALLGGGCAAPPPGVLTQVGTYHHRPSELAAAFSQSGEVLVVVGNGIYVPSQECLCHRSHAGAAEQRQKGAGVENRQTGAAAESRSQGGAGEARNTGGAGESRATGGASESRDTGGGQEARSTVGGQESRQIGAGTEQRHLQGASEIRMMGGGSIPIRCIRNGDCRGFRVLAREGVPVYYFDGEQLREAEQNFVPLR